VPSERAKREDQSNVATTNRQSFSRDRRATVTRRNAKKGRDQAGEQHRAERSGQGDEQGTAAGPVRQPAEARGKFCERWPVARPTPRLETRLPAHVIAGVAWGVSPSPGPAGRGPCRGQRPRRRPAVPSIASDPGPLSCTRADGPAGAPARTAQPVPRTPSDGKQQRPGRRLAALALGAGARARGPAGAGAQGARPPPGASAPRVGP